MPVSQIIHIRTNKKEELHQAIQKIYSIYMPNSFEGNEYSEEDAKTLQILHKNTVLLISAINFTIEPGHFKQKNILLC